MHRNFPLENESARSAYNIQEAETVGQVARPTTTKPYDWRLFLLPFLCLDHISMYFSSFFGKNGAISQVGAILGIFLRAGRMAELDVKRTEALGNSTKIIQYKVRSYIARK